MLGLFLMSDFRDEYCVLLRNHYELIGNQADIYEKTKLADPRSPWRSTDDERSSASRSRRAGRPRRAPAPARRSCSAAPAPSWRASPRRRVSRCSSRAAANLRCLILKLGLQVGGWAGGHFSGNQHTQPFCLPILEKLKFQSEISIRFCKTD